MTGGNNLHVPETDLVSEAVWQERKRIADETHDALNTLYAGVLLPGEVLVREVDELGHYDLAARLEQLLEAVRLAHSQLDAILREYTLSTLEKGGLLAAIEHYAQRVAPTIISITGLQKERLPQGTERVLYGIAIGAISNALRHAGLDKTPSGEISVSFNVQSGWAKLCVRDNGQGFDVGSVTEADSTRGLDLMRRIAASVGGTLTVASAPGEGTEIRVDIPIETPND